MKKIKINKTYWSHHFTIINRSTNISYMDLANKREKQYKYIRASRDKWK